ncbi:cytochrome P450 [Enhygromyxa salina]|uniref:cytochrome P450 n=1 Tax=Enhygromyxa salina TaxID=215803 RepID=UPI0011BA8060|nr:cytochrome P450 [Enhygromyxa salina]
MKGIPVHFDFDPDTESFANDPYPTYAWLRTNAPVYHWEKRDTLLLSRLEDLRTFLTHEQLSTDIADWEHHPGAQMFEQPGFEAWGSIVASSLFQLPPADHARVRKLASVALTPRAVRAMEDAVRATVERTLDDLIANGDEVVNIRHFAETIPLTVICDLFGVPGSMRAGFREFGLAVIRSVQPNLEPAVLSEIANGFTQGKALLEQLIEGRRADPNPPADLLTRFIEARDEAHRLSTSELMSLIFALIAAGSDTTVHGTCYAVYALLRHPQALAELQADRSLLRGTIEETLRWDSFGKIGLFRYALSDLEIAGVPVRKGQAIGGLMGAALRDPEAYDDPDRFDIHRENNASLTFGLGRHFCLGANLARTEMMKAIEILLIERFPHATLAGEPVIDHQNSIMRAMENLPVRLGADQGKARA